MSPQLSPGWKHYEKFAQMPKRTFFRVTRQIMEMKDNRSATAICIELKYCPQFLSPLPWLHYGCPLTLSFIM